MKHLSLLLIAALCFPLEALCAPKSSAETYRMLNMLSEVFRQIRQDYVDDISDRQLIESAIEGMLNNLDPYSHYIDKKRYKTMLMDMRGELEGVGVELTQEDNITRVITPLEGSPAWEAGILAGDEILAINDQPTHGLSLFDIGELLHGSEGTNLSITLKRPTLKDPFQVTLTRKKIHLESVRWEIEGTIAYIRLTNFNSKRTSANLKHALSTLLEKEVEGIVIDLRNNPGGLFEEAIKCLDFLIEDGILVRIEPRDKRNTRTYTATNQTLVKDLPLAVIINKGTTSCAEIMAGALKDHGRAIIVGERSFGKGRVQSILPLSSGDSAMRITTSHYLTPGGKNIEKQGIEPDVLIEHSKGDSEDSQKREAFALIQERLLAKKKFPKT